jgi:glycosyltransferase involved in cell wall biosynthesis
VTLSRPKICHISTVDISAGILLKNQMRFFIDHGIETHAMAAPGRYVAEVEAAGIPFHPVPTLTRVISPREDVEAIARLVSVLRRERFDLIHLHTPKAVLLGTIAGALAGVPRIYRTIHGFYFTRNANPSAQLFFVNMERVVNRFHHVVFSQNAEDVKTAQEKWIRRSKDIIFLGNGIDLTRFDPAKIDRADVAALRQQYGIGAEDLVIGFVGRLVYQKGMRELFAAFEQISADRPQLKLLLIGEADHDKDDAVLPEQHLSARAQRQVIRAGWQRAPERFYPLMDLFVLPSYREGFPRTPMEASALGIPVVATNIRGCREAVEVGVNGVLVESKDPQDLARGLLQVIDDPALRARLGAGGRQKALREFNEVDKFKTVYREYAREFNLPVDV